MIFGDVFLVIASLGISGERVFEEDNLSLILGLNEGYNVGDSFFSRYRDVALRFRCYTVLFLWTSASDLLLGFTV